MTSTSSLSSLLNPKGVAVVGASQRGGRGTQILANLKRFSFAGDIFAVNPRYDEVEGCKCFHSIEELPDSVDCLLVAVGADSACDVLERAFVRGIRAAVVISSGFGEGGHGEERAARLWALSEKGMAICGPNCYGAYNVRTGAAATNGQLPEPPVLGSAALISQSGALGTYVFTPLMKDRLVGFSHFVSCGNQIGTLIEDYVDYFIDDPGVMTVVAIFEHLRQPRRLLEIARRAREKRKTIIFFHVGRSPAGQIMARSHTGALVGNATVVSTFLRRCGILQPESYDELVETVALVAVAPIDEEVGKEVILVSGSGGSSAVLADELHTVGLPLASLGDAARARIREILPDYGSVTNPIDATGTMYDDRTVLPKLIETVLDEPGRPIIAGTVSARRGSAVGTRPAEDFAAAARASGRTIVAFEFSPLGGPFDPDTVGLLRDARVALLLGGSNAMRALRHLPARQQHWRRGDHCETEIPPVAGDSESGGCWDFLAAREALTDHGVSIVEALLVGSRNEAVAAFQRFGAKVALKAEVPGLLHKSDLGCVRLGCANEGEVAAAYQDVIGNAHRSGFADARHVLVQPMMEGVAEIFAGIVNDPLYGPTVSVGLGGIFIEVLKDSATEMAPLTDGDARSMIGRIKGVRILEGTRNRPAGDIDALIRFLVRLGDFAAANYGRFKALDLNPVIVRPAGQGVVAVDIAVDVAVASDDNQDLGTMHEST